jgi:hypothetical protein
MEAIRMVGGIYTYELRCRRVKFEGVTVFQYRYTMPSGNDIILQLEHAANQGTIRHVTHHAKLQAVARNISNEQLLGGSRSNLTVIERNNKVITAYHNNTAIPGKGCRLYYRNFRKGEKIQNNPLVYKYQRRFYTEVGCIQLLVKYIIGKEGVTVEFLKAIKPGCDIKFNPTGVFVIVTETLEDCVYMSTLLGRLVDHLRRVGAYKENWVKSFKLKEELIPEIMEKMKDEDVIVTARFTPNPPGTHLEKGVVPIHPDDFDITPYLFIDESILGQRSEQA